MRYERVFDGNIYHEYPTVNDLIEQDVNDASREIAQYHQTCSSGNSWFGVSNAKAVTKALQKGWPEGTKKMRDALGQIELPRMPSIRRKKKWRDAGDFVDIHKVNAGRIDKAWQRTERVAKLSQTGSHLTIAVDVTCSGGTSADAAMWRGAAACAIAEAAVQSGRAVRMVLVWSSRGLVAEYKNCYFSCEIKPYNQNVSIDVLMTMASLPGFYRLYGFNAYCAVQECAVLHAGLGSVTAFPRELLADGSKMVWVGMDNLSMETAKKCANAAAHAMMHRVENDLEAYAKAM